MKAARTSLPSRAVAAVASVLFMISGTAEAKADAAPSSFSFNFDVNGSPGAFSFIVNGHDVGPWALLFLAALSLGLLALGIRRYRKTRDRKQPA